MAWTTAIDVGRMDDLGRQQTALHRLDARAKILATTAFLLVVMSFPRHEVAALAPLFLFPALLGAMGNLPAGYLLRKVAIAAPFALLVGLGNVFLEREPAGLVAGHVVTGGLLSFVSILTRFVLTVWSGLVLVAATGMHPMCAGLERLGMPRPFSVQLLFLYRYLFLIASEGQRIGRAVATRGGGSAAITPRAYGSLAGQWLMRSMDRALRVHQAMLARGFDGTVPPATRGHFGLREWGFVAAWLAFFLLARTWNLAELAGALLRRHPA